MKALRLTLFVNDSLFAYYLSAPLFRNYSDCIQQVVFSSRTKASAGRVFRIFQHAGASYFRYRVLLHGYSLVLGALRGRSVRSQCQRLHIQASTCSDINALNFPAEDVVNTVNIAIALNLDQIMSARVIDSFAGNVINIHASKLPADKGISPAIWSFSRGDTRIWYTLYFIDGGVDSGDVICQDHVDTAHGQSLFGMYSGLCRAAGEKLCGVIQQYESGNSVKAVAQHGRGSYHGLPTPELCRELKRNKRRFITLSDIVSSWLDRR